MIDQGQGEGQGGDCGPWPLYHMKTVITLSASVFVEICLNSDCALGVCMIGLILLFILILGGVFFSRLVYGA